MLERTRMLREIIDLEISHEVLFEKVFPMPKLNGRKPEISSGHYKENPSRGPRDENHPKGKYDGHQGADIMYLYDPNQDQPKSDLIKKLWMENQSSRHWCPDYMWVVAYAPGEVVYRFFTEKNGWKIKILHPNGMESAYQHLSEPIVNINDYVNVGQPLAQLYPKIHPVHLHFEIRDKGKYLYTQSLNPRPFIETLSFIEFSEIDQLAQDQAIGKNIRRNKFPYFIASKAIVKNRQYAQSEGWEKYRFDIYNLLGFTDMTPSEELFAEAVAQWQKDNGFSGKDVDGIIGPNTWVKMKSYLPAVIGTVISSSPINPPSSTKNAASYASIKYDLPYFDRSKAVTKNRQYAQSEGWEKHRYDIYNLLGFTYMTPSEELFAEAVAQWQKDNGFSGKDVDGIIGPNTWARMKYMIGVVPVLSRTLDASLEKILQVAANSEIARYRWRNRGVAPSGYIKGMALVYARAYCKLKAGDANAIEMAKANTKNANIDALAYYEEEFRKIGMSNSSSGVDTLRHLFVLLIGLGMRESSGKWCIGRDRTANNTSPETAEAGLFQTSYNARTASPLLLGLFNHYIANPSSGFLDVFRENVKMCDPRDLENYGQGNGMKYQELSKHCPAFAAEFTAIALRNRRKHWGPINRKEVEIRSDCDKMLLDVQKVVDIHNLCGYL